MFTVKRAIIIAAGIGSRMQSVTLKTPKPLVMVNGTRMIDTVIKGLHNNGINEIYIVVGHLKEQFYQLEKDYTNIHIIENPFYKTCNNISSLYVARDYLEDVIIIDGDQIIYNDKILEPSFNRSGYNALWTDGKTNEWLMSVNDGIVTHCLRNGGVHGWQLYSISRWNKEDGQKLKRCLELEFIKNKNTQIYWDDIAMFYYPEQFKLGIKEMKPNDIIEIDTLDELISIDPSYKKYKEI